MVDTIPDFEPFVYPFLSGDLLQLSKRPSTEGKRKQILRNPLNGLAELHDRGIIHTDIKPNNILVNYEETTDGNLVIHDVKISDLEDSVLLPPGQNLRGCICGNHFWRSPESWVRVRQNTPSDVFSFSVVTIYVILDSMIFLHGFTKEEVKGKDAWWHIFRRHISYFATDEDSFKSLLSHIGEEDEWFCRFAALAGDFGAEHPRKPFAEWVYVDANFRDLIVKMTNLDPARRITAQEALEHPWFQQIGSD